MRELYILREPARTVGVAATASVRPMEIRPLLPLSRPGDASSASPLVHRPLEALLFVD